MAELNFTRVNDARFYGEAISDNIQKTPQGYLVCKDVKIARTGIQTYDGSELGIAQLAGRDVKIYRLPEDVFEPDCLRSFEGMPVTDGHPDTDVVPENFGNYAKGHAQNVRRIGDYIVADLMITDSKLINEVESGRKREVSAGYGFRYERFKDGYKAMGIRANHVAVVLRGRAGPKVRINDELPLNRRPYLMTTNTKTLAKALFGMAQVKDATVDDLEELLVAARVGDEEDGDKEKEKEAEGKDSKKSIKDGFLAMFNRKAKDEDKGEAEEEKEKEAEAKDAAINSRFDQLESAVLKLADALTKGKDSGKDDEDEMKAEDEEKEDGDEDKAKEAEGKDHLIVPREALAKLSAKDQKFLKDAARGTSSSGTYGKILQTAQKVNDRRVSVADALYENPAALGEEIDAIMNPHKKKEDLPASKFWS